MNTERARLLLERYKQLHEDLNECFRDESGDPKDAAMLHGLMITEAAMLLCSVSEVLEEACTGPESLQEKRDWFVKLALRILAHVRPDFREFMKTQAEGPPPGDAN